MKHIGRRTAERLDRVAKMSSPFLNVLGKDWDDLAGADKFLLVSKYRENFGVTGGVPEDRLFNYFLTKKVALISPLETIVVEPRVIVGKGVFASKAFVPTRTVFTWSGIDGSIRGTFVCGGVVVLPLLTVSYIEDITEIVCVAPNGQFCRLRDTEFVFDI